MRQIASTMAVGCALAVTIACGGNTNESAMGTSDQGSARASDAAEQREVNSGSENDRQSITLTGCLQQGGGALRPGYMLTMLNEPAGVGTSGSVTQSGSSVEREQMRIAARTYRLSPKNDLELDKMIGKQVRVTGVIVEEAEVPNGKGAIGSDSDSQRPNRDAAEQARRGAQLDTSDLARLEVASASIVSDACGDDRSRQPSGSGVSPGAESATPSGVNPR